MTGKTDDEWLSLGNIADDLTIALSSLYAMCSKGVGPKGHKIGKHLRIRRRDYESWLSTRMETGA